MKENSGFDKMREEQFQNCRLKIQSWQRLSMDQASSIAEALSQMGWSAGQLQALQLEVNAKAGGGVPDHVAGTGRRPLQDYQAFTSYLTASLWLQIMGDKPLDALVSLAHHLGKLGLKLPSEKTVSKVTALMLYRYHEGMDRVGLHHCFSHVKQTLKKELSFFQKDDGRPYVLTLPEDTRQLDEGYRSEAFKDEGPCQCQVDLPKLAFIHNLVPERMPKDVRLSSFGNAGQDVQSLIMAALQTTLGQARGGSNDGGLRNLQLLQPRAQRGASFAPALALNAVAESAGSLPLDSSQTGTDQEASKVAFQGLQLALPSSSTAAPSMAESQGMEGPAPKTNGTNDVVATPEQIDALKPEDLEEKPKGQNESQFDRVTEQIRQKLDDSKPVKQRPAASMKRPLCANPPKKTAPLPKQKGASKMKAKPMKKPTSNVGGKPKKAEDRPPDALKLYPNGCGKCRYKPGCCPSCYKARGEW